MLLWRRGRSRRDRDGEREARELVRECAGFLDGSLAHRRAAAGQATRGWEWVHALAHCDRRGLRRLAGRSPLVHARDEEERWKEAVAILARQMLARSSSDPVVLERLQRRLLVPLELELTAPSSKMVTSPGALVATVLSRLDGVHPPSPR